jgi:hypothetical protein
MTTTNVEAFSIVSFLPRPQGSKVTTPSFQPHTVKRLHDDEDFSIGDLVTNGTQMKGKITGFGLLNDHVYVKHTWSDVGMNLGSLRKVVELPSQHQEGDTVLLYLNKQFSDNPNQLKAKVKSVHFYSNKIKYDLEIEIEDGSMTRVYNIDSCFVLKNSIK